MAIPRIRTSYLLFRVLAAILTPEPIVDQALPGDAHRSPLELAQRHEAVTGGGLFDPTSVAPFGDAGSAGADYTGAAGTW
ncbi:MAG TPA: hypothetical protein VJR47_08045 [Stellaceae bacterium]|nr:hypothetical protein [Stellaceae bacterium]